MAKVVSFGAGGGHSVFNVGVECGDYPVTLRMVDGVLHVIVASPADANLMFRLGYDGYPLRFDFCHGTTNPEGDNNPGPMFTIFTGEVPRGIRKPILSGNNEVFRDQRTGLPMRLVPGKTFNLRLVVTPPVDIPWPRPDLVWQIADPIDTLGPCKLYPDVSLDVLKQHEPLFKQADAMTARLKACTMYEDDPYPDPEVPFDERSINKARNDLIRKVAAIRNEDLLRRAEIAHAAAARHAEDRKRLEQVAPPDNISYGPGDPVIDHVYESGQRYDFAKSRELEMLIYMA